MARFGGHGRSPICCETRPNHIWCADVIYLPMRRGFLYLIAIID